YEVTSKEWSFAGEPRQVYEGQYGRFLMTYFVSVSAVPYATKAWWGWFSERVKIVVSATIYVRIDVPPAEPVTISLSEIVGASSISIDYTVTVERVSPSGMTRTVSGTMDLIAELPLKFFRLSVRGAYVELKGGVGYGKFKDDGYIMVSPSGNIVVNLCLDSPYVPPGEPPFTFEGKLVYRNQYQVVETSVRLNSYYQPCGYFTLEDVALMPGSYRGNNSLPVTLKSGALEMTIPVETDVPGTMVAVSTPVVLAKPVEDGAGGFKWEIDVQAPVNVVSLGYGGSVKVNGSVQIDGTSISIDCPPSWFSSPGLYECRTYSSRPPYSPSAVYNGTAALSVYAETWGVQYWDTVNTNVIFLTHTSIQFVVSSIYRYLVMVVLGLLLASVILYALQSVFGMLGAGFPLNPVQMMLSMSVVAVLVVGLPYAYSAMLSGICSVITDPQLYEFSRAMGCPIYIGGAKPEDAIARLFSYYDLLITRVRADYVVWVKRSIDELGLRLMELFIMFAVLLSVAIALMATMNAPVVGSLASAILTFGFSIISVFVTLAPTLGLVLVFASLVEMMLVVAATLMLVIIPLGALLLLAPSPSIQVYGENMLGAGFFYLLLSPGIAPVVYGLYAQVIKVLEESVVSISSQVGPLSIPLARSFYPPVDLLVRISGYVVLTSIVLGIVVLVNIYLLTRTGIMASIGESLARIMRR
ncbi:MAG: hypothetical protein QW584_03590, partial [Thermofilaceae archaeon]